MINNLTVTFFSNYLFHHQTSFCEAMINEIGDGFRFVATEPMPEDRINMGYRDHSDVPYVIYSYKDEYEFKKAMELGVKSDVVIIGSAPDIFIEERLKHNKLTFRYYERFFKKSRLRILDPRVIISHYKRDFRYRNKNLHMLCAGAYTAPDCRFVFSYPHKTYKWGYFPEVDIEKSIDDIIAQKRPRSILWAGRQINWKHPEAAIDLAKRFKESGVPFDLRMIGAGHMNPALKEMIEKGHLQNEVSLLGFMPSGSVRKNMEESDIFIFTSDRNEGWGSVLNEAMSAGCAVVANRDIGSVPYLIEDGKNGIIYNKKDKKSLYENVLCLMENDRLRTEIQRNARETIRTTWNADIAAKRLLRLIDCINSGREIEYTSGPCSRD